jgi:hypothetical protein
MDFGGFVGLGENKVYPNWVGETPIKLITQHVAHIPIV